MDNSDLVTLIMYFNRCNGLFDEGKQNEISDRIEDLRTQYEIIPGIVGYGITNGVLYYDLQSIALGKSSM